MVAQSIGLLPREKQFRSNNNPLKSVERVSEIRLWPVITNKE